MVEKDKRGVWIVRSSQVLQQRRHQGFDLAARRFTFESPMTPIQPVTNNVGCLKRRLEPKIGELIKRLVIVGLRRKCKHRTISARLLFKQAGVVALDPIEMPKQNFRKRIAISKAQKAGKALNTCVL